MKAPGTYALVGTREIIKPELTVIREAIYFQECCYFFAFVICVSSINYHVGLSLQVVIIVEILKLERSLRSHEHISSLPQKNDIVNELPPVGQSCLQCMSESFLMVSDENRKRLSCDSLPDRYRKKHSNPLFTKCL